MNSIVGSSGSGDDDGNGLVSGGWGVANPRRGLTYSDLAKQFVADHPIYEPPFSADTLDKWLHDHGMLIVPPANSPKDGDAWMAHLQRRHHARGRLNKAGSHPRMSLGSTPFTIVTAANGTYEVLSPEAAASRAELPRKIQSVAVTKRKQLGYLMQSADWSALPVHEQAIAEAIYDDIEAFVQDTSTAAKRISTKLRKLERRIQTLLETGTMKPRNGGFKQLLAPDPDGDGGDMPYGS